jgi:hypothetical protein
MGKIADRASGPMGSPVAGLSGGAGADGISGTTLYHCVGISFSLRMIFVCSTFCSPSYGSLAAVPPAGGAVLRLLLFIVRI